MNNTVGRDDSSRRYPFFKMILRAVPIQIKAAPGHFIIDNSTAVFHGFSFAAQVFATKELFDAIAEASVGNAGFWDCMIPLLVLAGVTFGQQILNGVNNFHSFAILWPKSTGKLTSLLHRKLQRVDPARFEDTSFLDDLNKTREGAKEITQFCMVLSVLITFYGTYFASIGVYLFNLKPVLLLTLLIAFIPAMLAQVVRAKVFTKLEEQSAPLRREFEYYQKTLCDREYFKETRILGAVKFFHKLFSETMTLLTRKMWQAERKTALLQLMLNITSFAGMAIAAYMLFTATMSGEITVGAFAAVFSTLGMIFYIMQEIINTHFGNISQNVGKVANFIRMLDIPERTGTDGTPDFSEGVVAENISFTYPGRDTPAVKNVSLSLADGETIAVVGENGAGKSTLVRLLTGIYRPSEGKVTVGGLDTAQTAPSSVYRNISGVFQKYQRYKMTLEENVSISDTVGAHSVRSRTNDDNTSQDTVGANCVRPHVNDVNITQDAVGDAALCVPPSNRIHSALTESGFEHEDIDLDTMLSPEFDGIDLSGGQWQRVAIARGLYRTNDFIVLDEPTAAIDPIEETRVYTQFQRLAEGKCAIVVTHRLGSAKIAHRIIVMDAGEIVDIGTHDELLTRAGKYADMWEAQAQWYERETE